MAANTTPIYTKYPFHWRIQLVDQLAPRKLTTETPILLGTAGDYGALIWGIQATPLGDNVATVIRIYSKQATDTDYHFLFEEAVAETTGSTEAAKLVNTDFVLPDIAVVANSKGLHLESGESLYAALGTAVATGFNLFIRGGNY